eukprot:gnl/TRDRNA2_/TRDRNA2_158544_c1_seq2.p1 gnl/TRDRNA2_/TRDRNA2_158544_c1~~gnl/TRDRNA2_/TRDRNA2_158544_c1_seq2.p1  ORF type:complete len:124 (+),score=22.47 gnl/TRDRNA2_/TRDRNA2_158544_c1_seq2:49-420(+)
MSAPAGRTLGSAELRRRQLLQLGWAIHGVALRDLYEAVRTGTLRLFVSKLLSSFDPSAARKASFRSSTLQAPSTRPIHVVRSRKKMQEDESVGKEEVLRPLSPAAKLRERAEQAVHAISQQNS